MAPKLTGSGLVDCPLGGSQSVLTVGPYAWCDYVTDGNNDNVQIQAAIDAVASSSPYHAGIVQLTTNVFIFASDAGITIKPGVHLRGNGNAVCEWASTDMQPTQINVISTSVSPIIMKYGSEISGIRFYYPNQHNNEEPDIYPYTIYLSKSEPPTQVYIHNIHLKNSYNGIDASSSGYWIGGLRIYDIYGYPLHIGINIDQASDVIRISGIHFHPGYGDSVGSTLQEWVYNNAYAFNINWADGAIIEKSFAFGYNQFIVGTDMDGCIISNSWMDCCKSGMTFSTSCNRLTIVNNVFSILHNGGTLYSNDQRAIYIGSGEYHKIEGNLIFTGGQGIVLDGDKSIISGNTIQFGWLADSGSDLRGIWTIGAYNIINTNHLNGNLDGCSGIISESGSYNNISNNIIINSSAKSIWALSNCSYSVILGNNIKTSASLLNQGTGNVVEHNLETA